MVAIRLSRTGAKKKPSYRVVVIDKRRPRDSRNLEIVGHYNPRPDPIELVLKLDRIKYWMGVGAQPSDTVKRLMRHFDKVMPPEPVEESKDEAAAPVETTADANVSAAAVSQPAAPGQPVELGPGEEREDLDIQFNESLLEAQ
jgi:small subunit ribosomal protein S16